LGKAGQLNAGHLPICEPGLRVLLHASLDYGRPTFITSYSRVSMGLRVFSAAQCSYRKSVRLLPWRGLPEQQRLLRREIQQTPLRWCNRTVAFCVWYSYPGGYRHGVSHRQYITWAVGGRRGAFSTPLIAGRCDPWTTEQRQRQVGGNLLHTLRPTEASTQNDGSGIPETGTSATAAVPVSATGRRAAPVSAIGKASLAPSASSKSTTARQYGRRSWLTINRRPRSPRRGAWRDPAPS
jgi:hypothetical protein